MNTKLRRKIEGFGYTGIARLRVSGETSTVLYACQKDSVQYVAKVGIDQRGKTEVNDNIYGYAEINKIGASSLLPEIPITFEVGGSPVIIIERLTSNFKVLARDRKVPIYKILFDEIEDLSRKTFCSSSHIQQEGMEELKRQLEKWYTIIYMEGMIPRRYLDKIKSIDTYALSSRRSTLMLLDFTPDNVFVEGDKIKYIDPWRQGSYRGSLIPSISIFMRLLTHVYGIRVPEETINESNRLVERLATMLDLDNSSTRKQQLIGIALLYALSSFVRTKTNKRLARDYAKLGIDSIDEIIASP